jgi:signal transduction histidine kinase
MQSNIAHEFKTPLANISLPAELSYLEAADALEGRLMPDMALEKIRARMRYVLDQVKLASGRVEAVRETVAPSETPHDRISLVDVLEESLSAHAVRLVRQGIRIERVGWKDTPFIPGHAQQLEVAFSNLIKNAMESMIQLPEGRLRVLTLTIARGETWVEVGISDTGGGIPQELRDKIFEPRFSTKGEQGSGLGLGITSQIIQAHAGQVKLETSHSAGTVFSVRLPY